jgi:hypothetical protein
MQGNEASAQLPCARRKWLFPRVQEPYEHTFGRRRKRNACPRCALYQSGGYRVRCQVVWRAVSVRAVGAPDEFLEEARGHVAAVALDPAGVRRDGGEHHFRHVLGVQVALQRLHACERRRPCRRVLHRLGARQGRRTKRNTESAARTWQRDVERKLSSTNEAAQTRPQPRGSSFRTPQ